MSSILHRIEIDAQPEKVYDALTDTNQLSGWWAPASVDSDNADLLNFAFGEQGDYTLSMRVDQATPNQQVVWQAEDGPWAEMGQFVFDLEPIERGTNVRFAHHGWPAQDDFYMHCNSKWGFFLTSSLKALVETGTGQPSPREPQI